MLWTVLVGQEIESCNRLYVSPTVEGCLRRDMDMFPSEVRVNLSLTAYAFATPRFLVKKAVVFRLGGCVP